MSRDWLVGTLAYLFSAVSWGANVPLTTILFRTFDPFFLSFTRVLLASIVVGAIVATGGGLAQLRVPLRPLRWLSLSAMLAGFFLTYNLGLRFAHPIAAIAVMAGAPVYAAVTQRVVIGTPLEPSFWLAAVLTLIGTAIAASARDFGAAGHFELRGGELLILLSFVLWNLYSIFAQRWFDPDVAQIRRAYVAMLGSIGWLLLGWLGVWACGLVASPTLHPSGTDVAALLVTALFASGLSMVTWNMGVARLGLTVGSMWQNTVPVFALAVSTLFGIVPSSAQIFGGALVLAGVIVMQVSKLRAQGALVEQPRAPTR